MFLEGALYLTLIITTSSSIIKSLRFGYLSGLFGDASREGNQFKFFVILFIKVLFLLFLISAALRLFFPTAMPIFPTGLYWLFPAFFAYGLASALANIIRWIRCGTINSAGETCSRLDAPMEFWGIIFGQVFLSSILAMGSYFVVMGLLSAHRT